MHPISRNSNNIMISLLFILSLSWNTVSSSALCFNNDSYIHPNTDHLTCKKIRFHEDRRVKLCEHEKVRLNCPQTCGICCDDNPDYSFEAASGKILTCELVGKSSWLQDKYCHKFNSNTMVRNACPVACGFCQTYVEYLPSYGYNETNNDGIEDDDNEDNETLDDEKGNDDTVQSEQEEKETSPDSDGNDSLGVALGISLGAAFGVSALIVSLFTGVLRRKEWSEGVISIDSLQKEDKPQTHRQRLQSLKRTLRFQEQEMGKEHTANAKVHYDIGMLMFDNNNKNSSLESFQNAIDILDIDTSETNPNVATIHYMMAETYKKQKRYTDASKSYKKALKIHEKIKKQSTNVSKLYFKIGEMYQHRGDSDEALKYTRAALHTEINVSGQDDIKTVLIHDRIGTLLQEKNDIDRAYKSYRYALEILIENLEIENRSRRMYGEV